MTRYLSAPAVGMSATVALGQIMDRAPRPYTAREICVISGMEMSVVMAFLRKNLTSGRISSLDVGRNYPKSGWHKYFVYWRGERDIWSTFGQVDVMDGNTEEQLVNGVRPVSWRDETRTVWCVDETETVATMRGRNMVTLGHLESARSTQQGVRITIQGGTTLVFRRKKE